MSEQANERAPLFGVPARRSPYPRGIGGDDGYTRTEIIEGVGAELDADQPGVTILPPVAAGCREKDREQLAALFMRRLLEDFRHYGPETIREVRECKPDVYLKLIATLVPQQLEVDMRDLSDVSTGDLQRLALQALQKLSPAAEALE